MAQLPVAVDEQHAVARGDAEEGDESDDGRDAHHGRTYPHREHPSHEGQRQARQHYAGEGHVPELKVEKQENRQHREYRGKGEGAGRASRALELSAVLDAVAFGKLHRFGHSLLHIRHHAAHIASADIGGDDYLALHVLPADGVGAGGGDYVRHLAEGDLAPRAGVYQRVAHSFQRSGALVSEPQHHIVAALPFIDVGEFLAGEGQLHETVEVGDADAVLRECGPVGPDLYLRRGGLLLDGSVDKTLYSGDAALDGIAHHLHRSQVGAEYLDGDCGLGAGEHMVDTVSERLSDSHRHAGDGVETAAHIIEHGLLRPVLQGEVHIHLGPVGGLRVFVEVSASGAPGSARDLRDGEQLLFHQRSQFVADFKRRALTGHGGYRHRAFVEVRKEAAAHLREHGHRTDEQDCGRAHHGLLVSEDRSEGLPVDVSEIAAEPALALVAGQVFIAGQQILAEQRSDGHSHDERHKEGDDVGDAQRLEQPSLHPAEEEEWSERHHNDERGVDYRRAYLPRAFKHHVEDLLPLCGALAVVLP